jgi:RNA polymerase sigma-70 factor (ECF subfamily)
VQRSDKQVRLFEFIFNDTKDRLFGFLKKLLRDDDKVQDCMQQCYLKLWEVMDDIDTERNVLPLLYTYARNLGIDHLRKNARYLWLDDLAGFSNTFCYDDPAAAYLDRKDTEAALYEVLNQLPPRRREVFTLVKVEGCSYREAAERLQISLSTVEKHMHAAHRFFLNNSYARLFICWLVLREYR